MREIEPRQWNSILTLLAGMIVGLLLGLFIGWVVWPVEWQGATLNELFPTERAEYLGAVADAFALNRSPEAAEVARQRVAALGDNLSSELEAAIAHFSNTADPNRELRINNLTFLASNLGISTPGLVGVTQDAPANTASASDTGNVAPSPESNAATTPGWLTWLLYVLAGLLLIVLGLYLILRMRQGQGGVPTGEYIDREIGSLQNAVVDPWAQRTQSYVAADDDPVYAMPATADNDWQRPVPADPTLADEYSFDDDPEEPSHVRPGAQTWVGANRGSHVAQLRLDQGDDGSAEEEDFVEEDEDESEPPAPMPPLAGVAAPSAAAMRQPNEPPQSAEAPLFQSHLEPRPTPVRTESSFKGAATHLERPVSLSRPLTKYKMLEIYTAHYQVGIHDYNESRPLMDSTTGKYVGECGMGASTKNSLLQNHPDQVVALEVWLFDKTDEKNVGTQTRVLLSEYAIDHNLEQAFTKERQDDPRPFTAQPNTRFQLESQNLLLDCTITEAVYMPSGPNKGIFQSVTVEMAVYKKG